MYLATWQELLGHLRPLRQPAFTPASFLQCSQFVRLEPPDASEHLVAGVEGTRTEIAAQASTILDDIV